MLRVTKLFAWWLGLAMLVPIGPVFAQTKLDHAQLDQLTAPVALYPDALLSQVLMASTYPAEVASAAQWSKANPKLSGDAATKAVTGEPWDPSVQSLAAFPSVLDMMGREPKWVQSIGDAFLAQPDDVMDSVQRLRVQAQKAGSLKTTKQQKVTTHTSGATTVVQIAPANPQVVYVPAYNPTVVYGAWAYPAFPPAYYPPPPGSAFASAVVSGIGFGLGVAAVNSLWGGFNWGGHNVNINVNRYNSINVHQRIDVHSSTVNWAHNPAHRGDAPYNDANVRGRFEPQRQAGLAHPTAGGRPGAPGAGGAPAPDARETARDRAEQSFKTHTGEARDAQPRSAGQAAHNRQPGGADRQRADQAEARGRARETNRDSALRDAGDGERVRQQSQQASQHANLTARREGGEREHFGHGRR